MIEVPPPFEFDFPDDNTTLSELVASHLGTPATSVCKVGRGFCAIVYRASLDAPPHDVIIKCHRYAGRGAAEAAQLQMAARHALVRLPEVYGPYVLTHQPSADIIEV